MSNTESGNTGEFVKRRFSLTHEANDLIDELADSNHGGNRSACVRAAVYAMHTRRNEDELRNGLKRLQNEVEALGDKIESLQQVDSYTAGLSNQDESNGAENSLAVSGNRSSKTTSSESNTRLTREVLKVMKKQPNTVFDLDDFFNQVDCSLPELADSIDRLIQKCAVEEVNVDGTPQYQLIESSQTK